MKTKYVEEILRNLKNRLIKKLKTIFEQKC